MGRSIEAACWSRAETQSFQDLELQEGCSCQSPGMGPNLGSGGQSRTYQDLQCHHQNRGKSNFSQYKAEPPNCKYSHVLMQ